MWTVAYSRRAERGLADLPARFAEALRADLIALAIDPQAPVNVKKLEPKTKGVWRIRVGNYRMLFISVEGCRNGAVAGLAAQPHLATVLLAQRGRYLFQTRGDAADAA